MFNVKKIYIAISTVLLIACIVIVKTIIGITHTAEESYKEIPREAETLEQHEQVVDAKSRNILILGTDVPSDSTDEKSVRTDAIILLSYNADKNTASMLRIPRDLYVHYENYEGKINAIYEHYGIDGIRGAVESLFGTPITNYVMTDYEGLKEAVDQVGGIDIESEIKVDSSNNSTVGEDITINEGINHLDGKTALAYSRIRYLDNDIKRGERQEQVLKALIEKLVEPSQLIHIESNAEVIGQHIQTDISMTDVISEIKGLTSSPEMTRIDFVWSDDEVNGESIVRIESGERERIAEELAKQLGYYAPNVLSDEIIPEEKGK